MGKAERSLELARAMEALGGSVILAACRCASPAAGTDVPFGAAAGPGAALGSALYRRHRQGAAHGLPGFFLLGVGPAVVELWTESKGLLPGELLWQWRRQDVRVDDAKSKLVFTHLTLTAPELEPTKLRAVTGGFSGYGSGAPDLLRSGAVLEPLLDAIEAEVRRLGHAPAAQPTNVEAAFGAGQMPFTQWVAEVLLPRARAGQIPADSQAGAAAARELDGDPDAGRLQALLAALDRL